MFPSLYNILIAQNCAALSVSGLEASEKRLSQIEVANEVRGCQIRDLEQARIALTERRTALGKTLKTRETALARAEEKIAMLTKRNTHLEADVLVSRTDIEKRIEELNVPSRSRQ